MHNHEKLRLVPWRSAGQAAERAISYLLPPHALCQESPASWQEFFFDYRSHFTLSPGQVVDRDDHDSATHNKYCNAMFGPEDSGHQFLCLRNNILCQVICSLVFSERNMGRKWNMEQTWRNMIREEKENGQMGFVGYT